MLNKSAIRYFAKVSSGQGAPQRETDFSEEGIPFIRAGSLENLLNGKNEDELPKVRQEIAREYKLKLYQPNTIVFAKSGMSALKGRIYKLQSPCYVVNHLATLELLDNAISDYIVYALRYFSPVKLINDNAYPSLKQSVIENYEIPFPKDKKDQIYIAAVLSKAGNLISQRKESIRLLDEFLKSIFLEMFGDPGINPKRWPVKKLEEHIEYMGDIGSNGSNEMVAKNLEMLDVEEYAIMIRTTNLTRNDFTNNIKYVTQKTYEFFKKSKIYGGEIIMNKIGSAGDFWMMPKLSKPVTLGLNQLVIRPKNLPTLYLFYYLSTDYGRMIVKAQAKGATTKSITKTAVKALPLMYPPDTLQNQFVAIVKKTEALKTQYQQSLQELENLYGSLSQRAFKGELTLRQEERFLLAAEPDIKYKKKPL